MAEVSHHLLVAGGGAIGASLRWFAGLLAARWRIPGWWAVLIVNTVGCLAMGLLAGAIHGRSSDAFMLSGVLGGFTTFSTASLDVWVLWRAGGRARAVCCLLATPVLAIAMVILGISIADGALS